jgi:hypothetical protein
MTLALLEQEVEQHARVDDDIPRADFKLIVGHVGGARGVWPAELLAAVRDIFEAKGTANPLAHRPQVAPSKHDRDLNVRRIRRDGPAGGKRLGRRFRRGVGRNSYDADHASTRRDISKPEPAGRAVEEHQLRATGGHPNPGTAMSSSIGPTP